MKTLCCEFVHSVIKRILPRSHWRRDKALGSTKVGEKNKYSTRQCHKNCHKTIFDGMTEIQISVSQFQWAQTFHICLGVEVWLPTGEINWTGPWRMKSEHLKVSISLCWFSVQSEDEDFSCHCLSLSEAVNIAEWFSRQASCRVSLLEAGRKRLSVLKLKWENHPPLNKWAHC